ncbi:MAG: hypothetical protein R3E39_18990 [Anaerolineae bacterium]
MSLHSSIRTSTLKILRESLTQQMPPGERQQFYLWGTSPENPLQDEFIQIIGAQQIINLSSHLLDSLVDSYQWDRLAQYVGLINTYFIYEIVSDDLGIGLSTISPHDPTVIRKREILSTFNKAMGQKLKGNPTETTQLLQPIFEPCQTISSFAQSMSLPKYQAQLASYIQQKPTANAHNIEFGIWSVLTANIEACVSVVNEISSLNVGPIVREGFINRYRDVSESLRAGIGLSQRELINIGTHTVSVIPVLAYFTGVLIESLYPQPKIKAIIDDGFLLDALTNAATIVRLFNDVGMLLTLPSARRTSLLHGIWKYYQSHPDKGQSVTTLIQNYAEQDKLFTRLHKDIIYGEFNVCLQNLNYTESIEYGLSLLGENLAYYTQLLRQTQNYLRETLATIEVQLGDGRVSQLITNFVQFHEQLYANRYNSQIGEYVA